ncbi:MAG: hypothetical protein QM817_14120 [Archangium sp.]
MGTTSVAKRVQIDRECCMSSITLKQVPDAILDRLKVDAERERRSVNQHALWLLERALGLRGENPFFETLMHYRSDHAESLSNDFEVPRDRSSGRKPK